MDEKMKISFNAYRDEYEEFKLVCRQKRTTPTAMFVLFIRDVVEKARVEESNKKKEEE